MTWLIIKTAFRKEHYVACQIEDMGFRAWVPCQIITSRPAISRRLTAKAGLAIKELPILPKRIFAAVPMWAVHQAELDGLRYFEGYEQDAENRVLSVPDGQITVFRTEIDRENTNALALAQKASRRQKAKWRSLKDALLELVDSAKQHMEQAA